MEVVKVRRAVCAATIAALAISLGGVETPIGASLKLKNTQDKSSIATPRPKTLPETSGKRPTPPSRNGGRASCPRGGGWNPCVLTQYAQHFEGRRCADGSRFSHGNLTLASRGVPLGRTVQIRYGSQVVTVKSTDRGRLPLHRKGRPQFDVTRAVSRRLGLYKRELGRRAEWRMR